MIIEAIGTIFLIFFLIVLVIILIPFIVILSFYFKLSGNTLTLQKLWKATKDFFVELIKRFQGTKKSSNSIRNSNSSNVQDAEFREID